MQMAVLASGSRGNATFLSLDGVKILIDAGISARRICQELEALGERPESLAGIFITHEHRDHVGGLLTLVKKYHIPVYSRPETFQAMSFFSELPMEYIYPVQGQIRLGRVIVKPINISHDAAAPVGYAMQGSRRLVVATDTGLVTRELKNSLEGAWGVVLESNHDPGMVKNGPYPFYLKQRILSTRGHLSNEAAARAIAELKNPPKKLFLAHLSKENNKPELALKVMEATLREKGIQDIEILVTRQNDCVGIGF